MLQLRKEKSQLINNIKKPTCKRCVLRVGTPKEEGLKTSKWVALMRNGSQQALSSMTGPYHFLATSWGDKSRFLHKAYDGVLIGEGGMQCYARLGTEAERGIGCAATLRWVIGVQDLGKGREPKRRARVYCIQALISSRQEVRQV